MRELREIGERLEQHNAGTAAKENPKRLD